jgi:nucleoside phosphorylase
VVTALPHEFTAVCQVLGCDPDPVGGVSRSTALYALARVQARAGEGSHVVAVTQLPETGNNSAAIRATILLNDCPAVKHILMSGIAGAVPSPAKVHDHVRLGDIVVSDRNGVVQFDLGKETAAGMEYRQPLRPPSQGLLQAVAWLRSEEERGRRPWEDMIARGVEALGPRYARPGEELDVLRDDPGVGPAAHPHDPARRAGQPRVFHGPIASGNIVLKNPARRDRLRDRFGAKAVEMEASGVSDATWHDDLAGYLVVRGTCDYCNGEKNDLWQRYAALIAAAYSRCVIEFTPPQKGPAPQGGGPASRRSEPRRVKRTFAKVSVKQEVAPPPPAAPAAPPSRATAPPAGLDMFLGDRTQGALLRAAELPGIIYQALRVYDVRQAGELGAELEALLSRLPPGLLPAEKLRACYQALYDAEAAKVAGQSPAPAQSVSRMKDFLRRAKHVPGT